MKLLIAGFFLAAVYTSASAVADAPQKPPKTAEPARKPAKVAPAPAASGEAIPQLRTAVQLSAITGGKLIPTVVPGSTSPPVAIAPPTQVPPWPFYITILVIVTAGVVNYWLNTRTMRNQTSEATQGRQADHQNKISEYRHAWLQELRDTASELVKAIYQAQSALMRTNLSRDYRDSLSNRDHADVVAKHQAAVLAAAAEERVAMAEMRKHAAKIKLLFKPNDPQAAPLFLLLTKAIDATNDIQVVSINDAVVDDIVAEIQVILKAEWEITKERMVHTLPKPKPVAVAA